MSRLLFISSTNLRTREAIRQTHHTVPTMQLYLLCIDQAGRGDDEASCPMCVL